MYMTIFAWCLACAYLAPWWTFVIGGLCLIIDWKEDMK